MKSLLYLLLALCLFTSCATYRPIPVENGKLAGILPLRDQKVYYEFVEQVPGVTAEAIYRQARKWVAFNTIDSKAPFYSADNLSRDVIGPGRLDAAVTLADNKGQFSIIVPTTYFTVAVETFEGKFRLAFTSFRELTLTASSLLVSSYGTPIESPTTRTLTLTKRYFRTVDKRILASSEALKRFITEESALK